MSDPRRIPPVNEQHARMRVLNAERDVLASMAAKDRAEVRCRMAWTAAGWMCATLLCVASWAVVVWVVRL